MPLLALLICCVLALAAALAPAALAGVAGVGGAAGLALGVTLGYIRVPLRLWLPPAALAALLVAAVWPTAAIATTAVLAIGILAVRAPEYAFAGALVMFGFEGSIKMRLTVEDVPAPLGVGAALIDLALVVAVTGLIAADRGQSLRILWQRAGRAERLVAAAFGGWLALSLLQVPLGANLTNGIEGFRLVQFYVIAMLGGALLAARLPADRVMLLVLGVVGGVALYTGLRGITGPTTNELAFAQSRGYLTVLGDEPRNIGSFTSPVGLVSFFVPGTIFAIVAAYLGTYRRLLACGVFGLAMFGVITSYVRTGLVAVVAGVGVLAGMLVFGRGVQARRKLYAVALVVLITGGGYAATLVAGDVDPMAKSRAESLSDPFSDESLRIRFNRWERSLDRLVDQPLGSGVGSLGRATIDSGRDAKFTDSSYLKIFEEQGFLGGVLFVLAVLGMVALCTRRLARDGPLSHPVGVAALAGFVGFLVLCLMGEYIEQPGKTISWALLGVATWDAYGR